MHEETIRKLEEQLASVTRERNNLADRCPGCGNAWNHGSTSCGRKGCGCETGEQQAIAVSERNSAILEISLLKRELRKVTFERDQLQELIDRYLA